MSIIDKALYKMVLTRKGITQNELADKLGINKNTLSNKVNGHTNIMVSEAQKICEILDVTDLAERARIFLT